MGRRLRLDTATLSFGTITQHDERFGLYIVRLHDPLQPGQQANWTLDLSQNVRGFGNHGDISLMMGNGSFLHSYDLLPSFGYNSRARIDDPD